MAILRFVVGPHVFGEERTVASTFRSHFSSNGGALTSIDFEPSQWFVWILFSGLV